MKTLVRHSFFAQLVLDGILRTNPDSVCSRAKQKFFFLLRRILVRLQDPAVRYCIGQHTVFLPLSHQLPITRWSFPEYGDNLGRLAGFLASRMPDLCIIDIGANIGDSAAIIRKYCTAPVLCIEPSNRFFPYLEVNCAALGHVIPLQQLLGETDESLTGVLTHNGGTASLAAGNGGDTTFQATTLPSLLRRYPEFGNARLVKSDTDGFDARILRGARGWLLQTQPVLFLEFDPFSLRQHGDHPQQLLEFLRQCGYDRFIAYEEMGDFLLAGSLNDSEVIGDFCLHYAGWGGRRYADLAVFPATMTNEALQFTDKERSFYRAKKGIHPT